jgi:DMSO/TMAO reductase YedYZ heme-binding membrane subunit
VKSNFFTTKNLGKNLGKPWKTLTTLATLANLGNLDKLWWHDSWHDCIESLLTTIVTAIFFVFPSDDVTFLTVVEASVIDSITEEISTS